jgi:hypothetical protein
VGGFRDLFLEFGLGFFVFIIIDQLINQLLYLTTTSLQYLSPLLFGALNLSSSHFFKII